MYCKLYNNDCLEVMRSLNDDFIDLTVTSPPYDNLRNYNGNISQWSFEKFQEIAKELYNQCGTIRRILIASINTAKENIK